MEGLKNKIAIVTGASRGIGKSICLVLAQHGVNIVAAATNEELLQKTCAEVSALGAQAIAVKCDVSQPAEADKLIDAAVQKFQRVDILVNNAGITRDTILPRMKEDQWDAVMNVNLKGTFNCMKACSRHMMRQQYGRIINISSVIGISGNAGQANYAASKAGVIALTKSAAKEFGSRNITVNSVAPGFIVTDMTAGLSEDMKNKMLAQIPLQRLGEGKDVANAVLFLASNLADYMTGQVLVVDGGMVM